MSGGPPGRESAGGEGAPFPLPLFGVNCFPQFFIQLHDVCEFMHALSRIIDYPLYICYICRIELARSPESFPNSETIRNCVPRGRARQANVAGTCRAESFIRRQMSRHDMTF